MSAIPSYSEIVGLLKKGATIEAQEKIMELRETCVALQDEVHALKEKIKALEESLRFSGTLEYREPFYFQKDDACPFCPRCWEKDRRAIHLAPERAQSGVRARMCPECKAEYKTGKLAIGAISVVRR